MLCLLPGISSWLISALLAYSHAFFSKTTSEFFSVLAVANTGSCVGLQNKIGHPAHRYRQWRQVPVQCLRNVIKAPEYVLLFFLVLHSNIVDRIELWFNKKRLVI